jgi:hypothetical protein
MQGARSPRGPWRLWGLKGNAVERETRQRSKNVQLPFINDAGGRLG